MKKKSAFGLIELVCYLSVLVVVSYGIFYYALTTQRYLLPLQKKNQKNLETELILNIIRRDCASASYSLQNWRGNRFVKETLDKKNNELAQTVMWFMKDGGVCRSVGLYDQQHGKWLNKQTSFFKSSIQQLSLAPEVDKEKRVVRVKINYTHNGEQHTIFARLRNRVLA